MRHRTIVCPLIENKGHYLLCKMAADRGGFPGQWALSGGVEPGNVLKRRCGGKYAKSSAKTHPYPYRAMVLSRRYPRQNLPRRASGNDLHDLSHLQLRERQSRCDDQRGV